jgi:anti-sigma factor NepR-like protein
MQTPPSSSELKSFWTIAAEDAEGPLARAMRLCVGNELRKMYGDLLNEPIPPKIADLLHRLHQQ